MEDTFIFFRRWLALRVSGVYFYPRLWLTHSIILAVSGFREWTLLYSQFTPAPCSPPLGGSDGDSAVRFTPAVKYGGRENRLSRRETRCMSGHPCRAHHKLKWARKGQSVLGVLYEHLPRSESNNTISTPKFSRNPAQKLLLKGEVNCLSGGGVRSPSRAHFKLSSLGRLRCQLPFQVSLLKARQHSQPRVCLKRNNPQTQVDFASVQGRNPKA